MKSVFRLFLVPLVALAFAGLSFAQATPATPATPAGPAKKEVKKAEKPKATHITGEIVSLDAKAATLTVKVSGKEMNFVAETKGAKSALEKVKVGDRVRVAYTKKDGKLIARSVAESKPKAVAKAKTQTGEKAETKATEKKAEKKERPSTEKK